MPTPVLSVVIPVYNEADNIDHSYKDLITFIRISVKKSYELIYVNDGSTDSTAECIGRLAKRDRQVKLVSLSKNFGKEIALAAGIAHAKGKAILTMDGDGQHPADLIPDFVDQWRDGAQVVVGIRTSYANEGIIKRLGSKLFYKLFNAVSGVTMKPGSSDFRLMDREVQQEFIKLHEPLTITRGLIDWLGYDREYISFAAGPRTAGEVRYNFRKLLRLAAHSFVSLTPVPLYAFGYLGIFITFMSFMLGIAVIIEQLIMGDPLSWDFTGTAMLSILVIFLVGLVLVAQGVLALYVSYIYTQSKGRPLYVVNKRTSLRLGARRSS